MSTLRMKRVLITGAAQGIGKAIARRFAERGAEVVLTDLNEVGLRSTHQEFAEAGWLVRSYRLDVTDLDSIRAVRDEIHDDSGEIDILVNNAGVVFGGPFLEVPLDKHRLTYRVNTEGLMAMTHVFLPDLIASPRGHLVNIASASGYVGLPGGSTYASSKWAVIGFTESIRLELKKLGHKNVNTTAVCPLYVATGMFDGAAPPTGTQFLSAEDIGREVIEAVEKRRIWVLEPFLAKITPILAHCLPTPVSDFLGEFFGANTSMDSWQGHDQPEKKVEQPDVKEAKAS